MRFSPTTPSELNEIRSFLLGAFKMNDDAPFVDPALMQWKYYEPRPDFEGSRSFAIRKNGELVAHIAVSPLTLADGRRGASLLDWAALPTAPGAGSILLKHVRGLFNFLIVPGGSDDTRRVLPRIGFETATEILHYSRVLRPLSVLAGDPRADGWRKPARVMRSVVRNLRSPGVGASGVSLERSERFEIGSDGPIVYSPALLDYYRSCPGAGGIGYSVTAGGKIVGSALIFHVMGQARIAFIAADPLPEALAAAIQATRKEGAAEVLFGSSSAASQQAATRAGFHLADHNPVFVLPKGSFADANVSLLESDAAYLRMPGRPFS